MTVAGGSSDGNFQLRTILGNAPCKPLESNGFLRVSGAAEVLKKKELKLAIATLEHELSVQPKS